MQRILSNKEC
uniref:Uncharacterized protein n=1 Tax=Rhizophora mucronata TaxID=61149 RepID=A0A2P2PB17_RHIMU